jgi:four helix bundle protein
MQQRGYQQLTAWQKAIKLVVAVYQASEKFPTKEIYGLTNQLRRAAVSIPANIAEGHGRDSSREFLHFLSIARGSLSEVETHIYIAAQLTYLDEPISNQLLGQAAEVGRLITGLAKSIRQNLETLATSD